MPQETLTPDYSLLDQIEAVGPFQTGACFQCRKCTNGCPVTFAMDLYPDEVIRMVRRFQEFGSWNAECGNKKRPRSWNVHLGLRVCAL